jgi:hypothetical protein
VTGGHGPGATEDRAQQQSPPWSCRSLGGVCVSTPVISGSDTKDLGYSLGANASSVPVTVLDYGSRSQGGIQ